MTHTLPELDFQEWSHPNQSRRLQFASSFVSALRQTGLCALTNTGISPQGILELERMSRGFFDQTSLQKNDVSMEKAGHRWRGYFASGAEKTAGVADLKEGYYFGKDLPAEHPLVQRKAIMHGANIWPTRGEFAKQHAAAWATAVKHHMDQCEQLAAELLRALECGLGLSGSPLQEATQPEPTCLFRIFRYPYASPSPSSPEKWGVGEHTDMGFLTLLHQEEGEVALEVKTRSGEWISVEPKTGVFLINIGDMLEYCTRGYLWATPHRVRHSTQKRGRLSLPFFYDPAWDKNLAPLPQAPLKKLGWSPSEHSSRDRAERWDSLSLHKLANELSYGEFVWRKVKDVFPQLAQSTEQPVST